MDYTHLKISCGNVNSFVWIDKNTTLSMEGTDCDRDTFESKQINLQELRDIIINTSEYVLREKERALINIKAELQAEKERAWRLEMRNTELERAFRTIQELKDKQ